MTLWVFYHKFYTRFILKYVFSHYMTIKLFNHPKNFGTYSQIGTYKNHPVYAGEMPIKEWGAMTTDDGNGVCINNTVLEELKKSPKFVFFIDTICEHELNNGPVHDHNSTRSESEKEVIQYLTQQGI